MILLRVLRCAAVAVAVAATSAATATSTVLLVGTAVDIDGQIITAAVCWFQSLHHCQLTTPDTLAVPLLPKYSQFR